MAKGSENNHFSSDQLRHLLEITSPCLRAEASANAYKHKMTVSACWPVSKKSNLTLKRELNLEMEKYGIQGHLFEIEATRQFAH